MAKILYARCPECNKEFYIDILLIKKAKNQVKLKCPFCKKEYYKSKEDATINQ